MVCMINKICCVCCTVLLLLLFAGQVIAAGDDDLAEQLLGCIRADPKGTALGDGEHRCAEGNDFTRVVVDDVNDACHRRRDRRHPHPRGAAERHPSR